MYFLGTCNEEHENCLEGVRETLLKIKQEVKISNTRNILTEIRTKAE